MSIWSTEIKDLNQIYQSVKGALPPLEKELGRLVTTHDENMLLVYSRRCLEVIITDLCEHELKRDRGTEPLQRIIDKLNKEKIVPHNIIVSMYGVNSMSTFGAHPKDFDPMQIKPVLNNLSVILRWYIKYLENRDFGEITSGFQKGWDRISVPGRKKSPGNIKILVYSFVIISGIIAFLVLKKFNILEGNVKKTVAVLPFRDDSRDSTYTEFTNSVMLEILNRIQTVKELSPISRTSVEQYRNTTKSLPEIARELHVNYIVEGSGQEYEDSLNLRVQLFQIRKGREMHLWGESFMQKIENANAYFNIQSRIAQSIASKLNAKITPREKELIEKLPTDNLEAYSAWQKGQLFLNKFTPAAFDSAMKYFELAKEIDPEYALAHAGICDVWAYRKQTGLITPAEGNLKSMEAVMKAYVLDSNNAVVQYSLASAKTWGMFDWAGGESGFEKSISLNPNHAMTRAMYSNFLSFLGRFDEAQEQIKIARKLDPLNAFIIIFHGIVPYMAGRYDEAISILNDAIILDPDNLLLRFFTWKAYYLSGQTGEAYVSLKLLAGTLEPESVKYLEQGYLKNGLTGALVALADRLGEVWSDNQHQLFVPWDIAGFYSAGHETDKCIYWLEQAYKFRDPNIPYLLDPILNNVRDDSRFKDLCKKLNLPEIKTD